MTSHRRGWIVMIGVALAVAPVAVHAQGIGIPITRSIEMIVDTLLSIVRPVAALAIVCAGLLWMFGEVRVSTLMNIIVGALMALFAITIVQALF